MSIISCGKDKTYSIGEVPNNSVSVAIGGDVLLGRSIAQRADIEGWDPVTEHLSKYFSDVDYAIVNLESPIGHCLEGGTPNYPRLCGKREGVAALAKIGINAVTLSNNHFLDAGYEGLENTLKILKENQIVPLGANKDGKIKYDSLARLVVVSANLTPAANEPGRSIPIPTIEQIQNEVSRAKKQNPGKPILAIFHCGRENHSQITNRDVAYATAARNGGADAVVMHGSHTIRPFTDSFGSSTGRKIPVHFGLGNLLFDQKSQAAKSGEIINFTFSLDQNKLGLFSISRVKNQTGL